MSNRFVAILVFAASFVASAEFSAAGFGHWLHGRAPSPYVANYPYQAYRIQPIQPGYSSRRVAVDNPSVYTGRPVLTAPASPLTAYQLPPGGTSGPLANIAPPTTATSAFRPAFADPVAGYAQAPPPFTAPATFGAPTATAIPGQPIQPVTGLGSGLPFRGRNSGGEVPLAGMLRGNTTSNPFYGTGNIYPNNFAPSSVAASQPYSAGYAPTVGNGALPITPNAAVAPSASPFFPNAPQPRVGGLARFFGSLLGTNYRSRYINAPITYYRPVNTVDPITGAPVIAQQGCTSCVNQLQRIPFNTFQRNQPSAGLAGTTITPVGPMVPVAPPTSYGPASQSNFGYGPAPTSSYSQAGPPAGSDPRYLPGGSVAPVTGYGSPTDRSVAPIPSTDPMPSYFQHNTTPLKGSSSPNDLQRIPKPELESARPNLDDGYGDGLYRQDLTPYLDNEQSSSNVENDGVSNWLPRSRPSTQEKQASNRSASRGEVPSLNAPLPNVTYAPERAEESRSPFPGTRAVEIESPASAEPKTVYSDVRPIAPPAGYLDPYSRREAIAAPKLPVSPRATPRMNPNGSTNDSTTRVTVPIREATINQSQNSLLKKVPTHRNPQKRPVVRDSSGWLPL